MISPSHHPPEELLLDYATGSAGEAVGLLVATHLALCPRCRDELEMLECVGGALLGELANGAPPPGLPDAVASGIGHSPEPPKIERKHVPAALRMYPEPLRSYLAPEGERDVPWSARLPGVRYRDLDLSYQGFPVRVSALRGGLFIPEHSHRGLELNLVLQGGFTDRGHDFIRGDVAFGDEHVTHHLDIHGGEDCILLAVSADRLVPKTLLGKLLTKLLPI
jgi:putative transcriptional regulator